MRRTKAVAAVVVEAMAQQQEPEARLRHTHQLPGLLELWLREEKAATEAHIDSTPMLLAVAGRQLALVAMEVITALLATPMEAEAAEAVV